MVTSINYSVEPSIQLYFNLVDSFKGLWETWALNLFILKRKVVHIGSTKITYLKSNQIITAYHCPLACISFCMSWV